MRDFFISTFEKIVGVIVVVMGIAVIVGAFGAGSQSGILAFLGILVIGAVYVVLMGGLMYLGLGIYHNTKRMADAMDRSGPPG
ncbi:MAG: hypothetical protein ACR2OY_02875 [Boseongicola sp.]